MVKLRAVIHEQLLQKYKDIEAKQMRIEYKINVLPEFESDQNLVVEYNRLADKLESISNQMESCRT